MRVFPCLRGDEEKYLLLHPPLFEVASKRAEFRINSISEETWIMAASTELRNPKAASPTPMLSTSSVPVKFVSIMRRQAVINEAMARRILPE